MSLGIGEPFLASGLQEISKTLASPQLWSFFGELFGGPSVEVWQSTLSFLLAVLSDAQMKQTEDRAVKDWLSQVQDLVYDMEYMVDKIVTKELKRRSRLKGHPWTGRIQNFFPNFFFNFDLRSRIEETTSRLNNLATHSQTLHVVVSRPNAVGYRQRPESSSVNEPNLFGRDEDIAAVLNMVLRVEANDQESDNFDIIAIVGMTGIGKTALAKAVYNNSKVQEDFHLYTWVHVSYAFDLTRISREILGSFISLEGRELTLDSMQRALLDIVYGKKFLLVLDDVWSYASWEEFKSPFRCAAPGSRIIITTRNEDVARGMGPSQRHVLDKVEDAACWSVLQSHAYNICVNHCAKDQIWMYEMRKEVAKKCGGLPLAAVALGDVLRTKQNRDQWLTIVRSRIWDLQAESSIHTAFKMSYYDLPSHLKGCFAYCSIFPKSYHFKEQELVFLWMAEGLIGQPEVGRTPEELGSLYFQDLVSRSIFQQASSDGPKFVMHDLYYDLARWASGETTFWLENESTNGGQSRTLGGKARRLSYTTSEFDGKNKFQVLLHGDKKQVKRLRTFLPIVLDRSPRYISRLVLFDLLKRLERLRVLSLQGYCITMLPDSIGDMAYLRHLNLSGCLIRRLPKSTTSLYNLQTLILRDCQHLEELPPDIEKLSNLLHLDIKGANLMNQMPRGILVLTGLRLLSDFIIGEDGSELYLSSLRCFQDLRGELCISNLHNMDCSDLGKVLRCLQLKVLELKGRSQPPQCQPKYSDIVLDKLEPPECIEKLTISGYDGQKFPAWMDGGFLSFGRPKLFNLATLRLEDCVRCTDLPSLGLLSSLKNLSIIKMSAIRRIGPEIYGYCESPFPSLETLEIIDLVQWTHWDPINENEAATRFSRLCRLSILNCCQLREQLPDNLPLLKELEVKGCEKLTVSVNRLPCLRKLKLCRCLELVIPVSGLPNLSEVSVIDCNTMVCSGSLAEIDSLQTVSRSPILEFRNLSIGEFQQVRYLEVATGEEFTEMMLGIQQCSTPLTCLTELKIKGFSGLVTLPEVDFLPNLRKLEIESCDALSYLSEGNQHQNACLEHLKIAECSSLRCIFRNQLPSSLKLISIEACGNLKAVLDDSEGTSASASSSSSSQQSTALKRLRVWNCSELETLFSRGQLPNTLEHIDIEHCRSLKSVVERFNAGSSLTYIRITGNNNLESIPEGLHNLGCLQDIIIHDCPKLVCFPGELPNTTARVSIKNCGKLEALPLHFHTLNSLEKLEVGGCRKITRFPEQGLPNSLTSLTLEDLEHNFYHQMGQIDIHFPEQGLPNSLTSLTLEDLEPNFYHQMGQWGLDRLASLTYLSIGGWWDAVSFPQKNMKLPTSLTHLIIKNFPKLECLSASGFLHLTFLESLHIKYCPKLKCLPKEDLPSSLLQLHISDCRDLAKEMLDRGKGKYWSKIAFIPCVKVDGELL